MIGVFDSGFGGVSVLKEIARTLPAYRYAYLGDSAHAPYGPRSREEVYAFTRAAVEFLFAKGCELVVLACNTSSAEALRKIQQEYLPTQYPNRRVLGVIIPAAEEAVVQTKNNAVGVIATEGTARSQTFVLELEKLSPGISVFQQPCPALVQIVEAGEHGSAKSLDAVREYLEPLLEKGIDTLILGCTHYEHLLPEIKEVIGSRAVTIISEAQIIAQKLLAYLVRHPEIEARIAHEPGVTFYTTDTTGRFDRLGSQFFGAPVRAETVSFR
jgi:glutamate racemase